MAKIKSVIGCEITTNAIKAVEVTRSNGVYSILAMGYAPLEEGIVEEGFIRDADRFNDAISNLLSSGNFQSTNIAIAVNNENVLMRYASFPKVDGDKLRSMVLLQAQEFIPIPIQEMEVDYVVAGEKSSDGDEPPQTTVMLVAARKQMLEGYINIFTASKLQVIDIDSSLLSYCRGLNQIAGGEKYGVVNLADDVLNFIVIKGEEISMVRSISIPERNQKAVTAVFKGSLDNSFTDEDVDAVTAFLTSETSSTITYYSMQSDEPISKMYYIVNSTAGEKMFNELKLNVGVPMEIPQFYPDLQANSEVSLYEYASCIGIAVSNMEG